MKCLGKEKIATYSWTIVNLIFNLVLISYYYIIYYTIKIGP